MKKIILSLILILVFFPFIVMSNSGDPTYEISGYSIDLSSGNQTSSGTVITTIKENEVVWQKRRDLTINKSMSIKESVNGLNQAIISWK